MENKKLDEKSLKEVVKAANALRDFMTNLADEISKVLADIKAHKEENTWEMKCPYKDKDEYWFINQFGEIGPRLWYKSELLDACFYQGNVFPTEKAAELEAKRRNLLTRFRAFRDECNGDWKPDWNDIDQKKYIIRCEETDLYYIVAYCTLNGFNLFGYFKNEQDAERAIELFGDEIKELYVDCEG